MQLYAHAKINLYLDVTGRRPDGYHELVSLMCCIGIHDTVRFSFDVSDSAFGISVSCSNPEVPADHGNLAFLAAEAFFAETRLAVPGLAIEIEKRIPVGAGLGGGSSNAAAVLYGLNRYYHGPLSRDRLMELGRSLGADVPFFIFGAPAVATGIGEKLSAFYGLPCLPIVVIYPGRPLSTAAVYKKLNLALTKTEKINKKSTFKQGWTANISKQLFNVLEPAAMEFRPEIREAKEALLSCGADGALMSGSGSSVFGVFAKTSIAENAFFELSGRRRWRVFNTRLLT
ncbi:MAG: 4-(cytidine 5'-diphospho)-2-C-methyl-D-erythritol kinase [Desulfobacteraceae bacterium]|nr:4-(cytidine 5'-diphospho)-2-C-methyl-D-erythritol kinase [Desulfobacteraceae bacterium]